MLKSKLLSWIYYERKIPLYVLNAYGVQEFFKIMVNFLINQDNVEDTICYAFNIYDEGYSSFMMGYDKTSFNYTFLDLIANLYGVSRAFGVEYVDEEGEFYHKDLYLNNDELLMLIKARIIQNNFDGTYESTREFYDRVNMPVYLFQSNNPAEAYVYISTKNPDGTENIMSNNIKDMIYAGLFTIKSMGITYHTYIRNVLNLGIWDSESNNRTWDVALWS